MATFPEPKPANGVWNTVTATWNNTPLYWSWIAPRRKGASDTRNDSRWLTEPHNPYKKNLRERFVKIFMTVHNQFLNEEQNRNTKIAGIYPTYNAKFEMKQQKGLIKENQTKNKVGVKVVNTKIGLETI